VPSPRKSIYHGKVIDVNIETARMPDGHSVELEVVRHPGGAAVVALDAQDNVCLLRQYRHAADGWLWELPAGKLEPNEAPRLTAERELAEEAGLAAKVWTSLGLVVSSPGVFTETVHLFLARRLTEVERHTEPHEYIEVHWIPLAEALEWVHSGNIVDGKTLVGLCRAGALLRRPAIENTT
jgi:8-oxo-dGTP pyrophosphatase MutT (NUDIX family)